MGKSTSNPARAVATSPAWAVTGRGAGKVYSAWEERVASGPDDGYWDEMMGFDNSSANTFVSTDEYGTQMESSFFRFASVEVFRDATITEATLELIMASGASYSFDMAVKGEDVDDSVQYEDPSHMPGDATNTTASVTWTGSGSWAADEVVQSPDIKTIITEITGRSGWSSGNALTLRVFYDGETPQAEGYSFKTYDSSSSVAAKLTIKYS